MGSIPRPKPVDRMRARMKQNVPVDTEGLDPEMRSTINSERGRIETAKDLYGGGELASRALEKNPRSTAAKSLRQGRDIKDSYDDMVAKARGERAYFEGSPSRTKGALAIRMGRR